ncbi:MAG: DUF5668 domain-containing protein [Prevotellaceae bacterium]|nr:DUF5668 domain-containing protein [Prevotellaceae bacterium]
MEMIQNNNNKTPRYQRTSGIMAAVILIVVGLLFLGGNLGYIDTRTFRIFVSWQMLLIVLGAWSVIRRHYAGGLVLLAVGIFFIIPRIAGITAFHGGWVRTYWPVLLIAIGVILIVRKMLPKNNRRHHRGHDFKQMNQSDNGFLRSDNMLGSVKHIILDPVFKGACIKNSFAGTIIDFRGTKLDAAETFIDVDCLFGGIEIHAPSTWHIVSELRPMFGGYNDKRFKENVDVDYNHKLVIRGSLTFSGLEVKN